MVDVNGQRSESSAQYLGNVPGYEGRAGWYFKFETQPVGGGGISIRSESNANLGGASPGLPTDGGQGGSGQGRPPIDQPASKKNDELLQKAILAIDELQRRYAEPTDKDLDRLAEKITPRLPPIKFRVSNAHTGEVTEGDGYLGGEFEYEFNPGSTQLAEGKHE